MKKIREDRVIAMADWLETIPPQPPFHQHPDFAQFSDLTDLEIDEVERIMRARSQKAADEGKKLQAELDRRVAAPKPQPIDTAPKDGGWILGHVPVEPDKSWRQPWMILTWGDSGWVDANDYYEQQPVEWVPLPDPQPSPTGWTPASGTIRINQITGQGWTINGQPAEVPYRWEVYIELPDGSLDEYRELWHYVTLEEADKRALKWRDEFCLPLTKTFLDKNVVTLRPEGLLQ